VTACDMSEHGQVSLRHFVVVPHILPRAVALLGHWPAAGRKSIPKTAWVPDLKLPTCSSLVSTAPSGTPPELNDASW